MKRDIHTEGLKIALFAFILVCIVLAQVGCKKSSSSNTTYDLKMVADNLVSPVQVVEAPDNTGRLFIVDETGQV